MLIEPEDLPSSVVVSEVAAGWNLPVREMTYAPLGFGSHHWWLDGTDGQRWFVTVDDLRMGARNRQTVTAALATAAALRNDGLSFVVAPLPQTTGDLTAWIPPHWVLAVYPHIEGEAADYGAYASLAVRSKVIGCLAAMHARTDAVRNLVPVDDLQIPKRADLETALATIDIPWASGPFAGRTQALLSDNADELRATLAHYDRLAAGVQTTTDRWVVTHGEPHRANIIVTSDGPQLIDWETARRAPPERDLWSLIDEDDRCRAQYEAASGTQLDDTALDLYRLWWDLCEVSLYTADLRAEHAATSETEIAWHGVREHLPVAIARARSAG